MITVVRVGGRNEYHETVRYLCGHVQEIVTLGYKMGRRQVAQKRMNHCPRCQLAALAAQQKNKEAQTQQATGPAQNT